MNCDEQQYTLYEDLLNADIGSTRENMEETI